MELKDMTIEELEARKAEIAAEVEADGADLDALQEEVRAINEEMEARSMGQYSAYDSAIRLLTDKEFFNRIWEIYNGGTDK